MVMELLVGEPLDRRIERLGRLSLPETARILGQVCRALQRAHDAGIIHRDLKPENIFLVRSPDDDDEIAKVLDFGIAKIKAPPGEQGLTSSTKTGAVLGTPYYMSPEQARGLRNIDHRADLWSLGVIAYKCVTGVLPFEGESVGDLLVKICTAPPPMPSVTTPGLPRRSTHGSPRARARAGSALPDAPRSSPRRSPLAAGLSVARRVERPTAALARSPVTPLPVPIGERTPMPAAGVTSAPFTASTVPAEDVARGVVGVAVAALVGGTLGVVGVVKLVARPGEGERAGRRGRRRRGAAGADVGVARARAGVRSPAPAPRRPRSRTSRSRGPRRLAQPPSDPP